jgi:hypothetical protein
MKCYSFLCQECETVECISHVISPVDGIGKPKGCIYSLTAIKPKWRSLRNERKKSKKDA